MSTEGDGVVRDLETNVNSAETASRHGNTQSRCVAFSRWIKSASFLIYVNVLLSQWGDWMWQYAAGIYLNIIGEGSLLLAAIFGFIGGGFILIFGGIIGNWVDRNRRLKVVRISLLIQNLSVAASCVAVCFRMSVGEAGDSSVRHHLLEAGIIAMAIVAQLASVAYRIAIEKDWIVVVADGNSKRLATLNAVCRSLDLTCKILAPMAVGFIMSNVSHVASAIVIAAWNVVSVFLEYIVMHRIYRMVPQLAVKHVQSLPSKENPKERELLAMSPTSNDTMEAGDEYPDDHRTANVVTLETDKLGSSDKADDVDAHPVSAVVSEVDDITLNQQAKATCCQTLCSPVVMFFKSWKVYSRQPVVYASIALSLLYMTVLGFDSITIGFIHANHVSDWISGICMALAGFTGILGTVLFTRVRRRIGLERTGLIAFNLEIICLVPVVISIWMPGSIFDPFYASRAPRCNESDYLSANQSFTTVSDFNDSGTVNGLSCEPAFSGVNVSIILFLAGIILSRVGLWMADLVVTQLMQESVIEQERGVVNGVQNSFNMLMDMLKFALVIVLPHVEMFGILILLSFAFIVAAGMLFAFHSWRVRGHLFHFSKLKNKCCY